MARPDCSGFIHNQSDIFGPYHGSEVPDGPRAVHRPLNQTTNRRTQTVGPDQEPPYRDHRTRPRTAEHRPSEQTNNCRTQTVRSHHEPDTDRRITPWAGHRTSDQATNRRTQTVRSDHEPTNTVGSLAVIRADEHVHMWTGRFLKCATAN
jgi:hypothetical protein